MEKSSFFIKINKVAGCVNSKLLKRNSPTSVFQGYKFKKRQKAMSEWVSEWVSEWLSERVSD